MKSRFIEGYETKFGVKILKIIGRANNGKIKVECHCPKCLQNFNCSVKRLDSRKSCGCFRDVRDLSGLEKGREKSGKLKVGDVNDNGIIITSLEGSGYTLQCHCGEEFNLRDANRFATRQSCGCNRYDGKDLTSEKNHFLTALEPTGKTGSDRGKIWKVQCSICDREVEMSSQQFGSNISCGCLNRKNPTGCIYKITKANEDTPVYIGHTTMEPRIRLKMHFNSCKLHDNPFHLWLRENPTAKIEIIEDDLKSDDLLNREKYNIGKFSDLLNVTYNNQE